MKYPGGSELPPAIERVHRKAVRIEWISIAYLTTATAAVFFTLGSSQAMKGAWLEDMLSLAPPIAFLVAARVRYKRPDGEHPYGYHRAVELAFLIAAVALFALGGFLVVDSALTLLSGDHPPIGMVELFDWQVWLGWLMIAALLYSAIPVLILGRIKMRLAAQLHDKVLYADAKMNRADWMTAGAALIGVIGIGFGLWWGDAAAAIVIGLDIVHDAKAVHPLVAEVRQTVASLDWVEEAAIRTRELGHVFSVEVIAVPRDEHDLLDRVEEAVERICALDWKVQDAVVAVVRDLEDAPEDVLVRGTSVGSVRA